MKLYNTRTMQKEEFVPIVPGKVRMYACGPTVYNYIHVGNARPIIMFDVLRRYLEYRGYEVTFVQNFTDVDDKIIKRANEPGRTAAEVATEFSGHPLHLRLDFFPAQIWHECQAVNYDFIFHGHIYCIAQNY